jgi:phospholipid transport system substrate-binding protein
MLIFMLCSGFVGASTVAEPEKPTQLVQRLIRAIGSMKAAENGSLSATDEANNAASAKVANTILDIPGVSQWTLGRHWKARSQDEQQVFVLLIGDLFAKVAYPKSAEFFSDLEVSVTGERVTGQRAVVRTTVTHTKEGLISIDYRLIRRNGYWRVRDIVLDDVSLATNLRSQFNKIITKHSYTELLRRMQKKLAE